MSNIRYYISATNCTKLDQRAIIHCIVYNLKYLCAI